MGQSYTYLNTPKQDEVLPAVDPAFVQSVRQGGDSIAQLQNGLQHCS